MWLLPAAGLVVAALVGITAVMQDRLVDDDVYEIFFTVIAVARAGSTLAATLALVERERPLLGLAALVLVPLGFLMMVDGIWSVGDFFDTFKLIWTGALIVGALALAVSSRLVVRAGDRSLLAHVAGAAGGAAATISIYGIWRDDPSFTLGRASTALWIVGVLAFLLMPLLHDVEGELARREAQP